MFKEKSNDWFRISAFIVDVIFGFISAILGLLLYSGNNIAKIVRLIGLASGVIGFVLTFVNIIYSGIVFNNNVVYKEYESVNPYSNVRFSYNIRWSSNKI